MSPTRTNVARRPFRAARRIPLRSLFTLLVGIALTCGGCEQAADQSARLVAEGLSLAERGDHAAAFARFERAGIADPSSPRGWVAAAELATDLGDYERAERGFSEAMRLDPTMSCGNKNGPKSDRWPPYGAGQGGLFRGGAAGSDAFVGLVQPGQYSRRRRQSSAGPRRCRAGVFAGRYSSQTVSVRLHLRVA